MISGGSGNDMLFGDENLDEIFGGNGNDIIEGGAGADLISGQNGNDLIESGDGNDRVFGGADADLIRGGNGNDFIRGGAGADRIFGESGSDELFGDDGIDSLVGGAGAGDLLRGGLSSDRYLTFDNDQILDFGFRDAQVSFRNGSGTWTNGELEIIDNGLRLLHVRTLNGSLLTDPIADQLPIVFIKANTVPPSLRLGINELAVNTTTEFNPQTGQLEFVTVQERQITIPDFDENDALTVQRIRLEIPREIAISWASDEAIVSVIPNQDEYFSQFEQLSDWTSETPDNISLFTRSEDNSQFYRTSSNFVDDPLATFNSTEDFASVWQLVFSDESQADQNLIPLKSASVNFLLDLLST